MCIYVVILCNTEGVGEGGEVEEGERGAGSGSHALHNTPPESQRSASLGPVCGTHKEREGEGWPVSPPLEVCTTIIAYYRECVYLTCISSLLEYNGLVCVCAG